MVNLMQVKPSAVYEDPGLKNCTGLEAFARCASGSAKVRDAAGAGLISSGNAIRRPIGPTEKSWHMVALVRYPSARAYLTMRATDEYQAARVHRRAALHDSRLIMTSQNYPGTD